MSSHVIWKFELGMEDEQVIDVPTKAQFLTCQLTSDGHPCIWALVDPQRRNRGVTVYIIATGGPVADGVADAEYLGMVRLSHGNGLHIFVEKQ